MSNRFSTPLPNSVLDRYYAEHPGEYDPRSKTQTTASASPHPVPGESVDDFIRRNAIAVEETENFTHHLIPKAGVPTCRYCKKSRSDLAKIHGDQDVTHYGCPDAPNR